MKLVAASGILSGRISWTTWTRSAYIVLPPGIVYSPTLFSTSYSAVTFEYCEPAYVNVARANPNRLSRHAGNATGTSYRLAVDGVFATCVDAGMCIDSALQEPAFQSATSTRPRKWLALMHHNQCFERWQTVKCLVAGEQQLYTAMIPCEDTPAFAVMYQSMLGPDTKTTRGEN